MYSTRTIAAFVRCRVHIRETLERRHPILLANDHTQLSYRFRHVRDVNNPEDGRPLGEFVLDPKGRQWIETPLGVRSGKLHGAWGLTCSRALAERMRRERRTCVAFDPSEHYCLSCCRPTGW